MSFWGRIFGAPEAVEKIAESAARGFDALIYTEEERETDAREERKGARGMIVDWIGKSQGQNLSRRVLAFAITFTWLFLYLVAAALASAAIWADPIPPIPPEGLPPGVELLSTAARLDANAIVVRDLATEMNGAVMLILAFYFAAPHIGNVVGPAMARFGGGDKADKDK